MKAQREIEEEEQKKQKEKQKTRRTKRKKKKPKFFKCIENKSEGINYLFFKYYFNFIQPSDLAKTYLK